MAGSRFRGPREQAQIDELMEETSRVGAPRPANAAERRPKLRRDPDAPVQERRVIEREKPVEPVAPSTAGRTSFGVGMGDQDKPRRRY